MNIRAQDTDGVVSSTVEGTVSIRSGRLKMQNAYGSELLSLPVPLEAQYWTGNYYATNVADSCTVIPMASIAMGNYLKQLVAGKTQITSPPGNVTLVAGKLPGGYMQLSAPGKNFSGSVDLTLNLGALSWFGVNPTARATFGIYSSPLIYRRENY
jgi:MSHA biogenesis protein MshQ